MHLRRLTFSLAFVAVLLTARASAGDGEGREPPAALGGNAPGMKEVVYGFFDDRTGERVGRLRIESVGVEYPRHGFLRVAWDPLVVLDGVTLEIDPRAAWPAAGAKIIDALRVTGRTGACVLRRVSLRLGGETPREIVAGTATLRADGALELSEVTPAAELANDSGGAAAAQEKLCFWLAGPQAGRLTAAAPTGGALAQTFSTKQTSAQPAP